METLYGESPEIQIDDGYGTNGGIALYSAGDGDGETITGGSGGGEGSYPTSSRYYWSITRIGTEGAYTYTGGMSGNSFYTDRPFSPFYNVPLSDIWEEASTPPGNLDKYFAPWNANSEADKLNFQAVVVHECPKGCYRSSSFG